jgi:branched-chain amino acid transport system permease protein
MRPAFARGYGRDIDLFRHRGQRIAYGALGIVTVAAPLGFDIFWLGEATYVLILAIAGIGLMILSGYTGLVSLSHAVFVGIAAYAHANLLELGVPLPLSMVAAASLAALVGVGVALPTLRLSGIYLAIATLAFGVIVEQVFVRWEVVTRGFQGYQVPAGMLFGINFGDGVPFYYMCLAVLALVTLGALNILRSPTGRALVAIRGSAVAARSMGVNLAVYKTIAFALSAFFTGLAGTLLAHRIGFLAPDAFNLNLSVQLLLLIVIGGLGSLHGAFYGAIFVGALPQMIAILRDLLPARLAMQPGLEPGVFGLILVLCILFEPLGIYGRWLKIKLYFDLFPLYKRATFKRQKSYTKSERNR